jgi:hypothetical protein
MSNKKKAIKSNVKLSFKKIAKTMTITAALIMVLSKMWTELFTLGFCHTAMMSGTTLQTTLELMKTCSSM